MQVARDKGIALEPKDFVAMESPSIQRADGKLGIMLVGLGAVSSTLIAGVEQIRRGVR